MAETNEPSTREVLTLLRERHDKLYPPDKPKTKERALTSVRFNGWTGPVRKKPAKPQRNTTRQVKGE